MVFAALYATGTGLTRFAGFINGDIRRSPVTYPAMMLVIVWEGAIGATRVNDPSPSRSHHREILPVSWLVRAGQTRRDP